MSFLTSLALLAAVLVGAPVAAHLLRRKRATEVVLPTASLLAATPPTARRRSALEDRGLLVIRIIAIILLALLGATPFISCSHVAVLRKDGASVAMVLVVDDSLSMRSKLTEGTTRFDRAKNAARDLIDGAEPGDSFAIVLAGSEARVHLASTTDASAARAALDDVAPSDRSTDLTTAIGIARDVLRGVPQPDKRIVVLSDLADGDPDGAPLEAGEGVALWYPLPDLESKSEADCAIVATERRELTVDVSVRCAGVPSERRVEVVSASDPKTVLGSATLQAGAELVSIKLPENSPAEVDARLSAGDALAADDIAPVALQSKESAVGVLADAAAAHVETGGPPPVEQGFAALQLGPTVRPLSAIPEHVEELGPYAGIVLDDPPGLTPEERKTMISWVEGGGVLLVSLGRKATAAPLGAGFGSLVPGVIRWSSIAPKGVDASKCGFFSSSANGLADIAPKGRTQLPAEATKDAETLCAFEDGEPLLLRRHVGKGSVYLSTLPFDFETSDFALRPAFLVLLDRFVEMARTGGGAKIVEAGKRFSFIGVSSVEGQVMPAGEQKSIALEIPAGQAPRIDAARIGRYLFKVDGAAETRLALASEKEIDLRPRKIAAEAKDPSLGGEARKIDASPYVAMALLGLMVLELLVRLLSPSTETAAPTVPTSRAA
ncbi:MAG: VWA domain-containing protein [Polyangiaceae bacterium]|nr:VWA domain-containing protein [Polyangiaceae bacterium]